jgi:hypothetical protein
MCLLFGYFFSLKNAQSYEIFLAYTNAACEPGGVQAALH